jgi:hypothetical protein
MDMLGIALMYGLAGMENNLGTTGWLWIKTVNLNAD